VTDLRILNKEMTENITAGSALPVIETCTTIDTMAARFGTVKARAKLQQTRKLVIVPGCLS
jgi:hypothetical protein